VQSFRSKDLCAIKNHNLSIFASKYHDVGKPGLTIAPVPSALHNICNFGLSCGSASL
jgi:hypothetical protein